MDKPCCAICCESVDRILIKDQAIKRLISSSKQLSYNKYISYETATTLRVHELCKKAYIKQSARAIDRCIKERFKRLSDGRDAVRKANIFKFKTLCFFCEKICNKFKQDIRMVLNIDTKKNIIEIIKNRNLQDQGSKKSLAIINSVSDLVKEEARYHVNCFKAFMKEPKTGGTVGRPASQNSIDFTDFLIDYYN